MGSIPVSNIVEILPNVVNAGGNPLSLNGVMITQSEAVPNGAVLSFSSADAVTSYFGAETTQARIGDVYFKGFDNATKRPDRLLVARFSETDATGVLYGGTLGLTLAELKTITGTLSITVAGVGYDAADVDLTEVASFSEAATYLTGAFSAPDFIVTYDATHDRFVFTTSSAGSGNTITFASGTASTALKLTQATGAMLSQGIQAQTESEAMDIVVGLTQNWASFLTDYEPDAASKKAFGTWANLSNQRYLYICYDSSANTIVANSSSSVGAFFKANNYDGVVCISGQPSVAAANDTTVVQQARDVSSFLMGAIASIDFTAINGRITFAFKHQAGLAANVDDAQIAANLIGNGYNFYGAYATANNSYSWFNDGNVSGRWIWLDEYINQIFLNSQFQLSGAEYLNQVNSMPYNQDGYTQLRQVWADPIAQGLNAGIIRTGVPLSASQAVAVNSAAGIKIDDILSTTGYYLQILPPTAQNRALRKSPICNFWYTSGGAVQKIVLNSIDVL